MDRRQPLRHPERLPAHPSAGAHERGKTAGGTALRQPHLFAVLRPLLAAHLLERNPSGSPLGTGGNVRYPLPGSGNPENVQPYPRHTLLQSPALPRRQHPCGGRICGGRRVLLRDAVGPGRQCAAAQPRPAGRPAHRKRLAGRFPLLSGSVPGRLRPVPLAGRLGAGALAVTPKGGEPGRRRRRAGMGVGPYGRKRTVPVQPQYRRSGAAHQLALRRHRLLLRRRKPFLRVPDAGRPAHLLYAAGFPAAPASGLCQRSRLSHRRHPHRPGAGLGPRAQPFPRSGAVGPQALFQAGKPAAPAQLAALLRQRRCHHERLVRLHLPNRGGRRRGLLPKHPGHPVGPGGLFHPPGSRQTGALA